MKKRWAFLTMVVALALGIAGGLLFGRTAQTAMHIAFSCVLLGEAEKAGYLDGEKRRGLIEKVAAFGSLDAAERRSVTGLQSECPKI